MNRQEAADCQRKPTLRPQWWRPEHYRPGLTRKQIEAQAWAAVTLAEACGLPAMPDPMRRPALAAA